VDVQRWRAEFPILARKTYLNSCSLGALSHRAEARVRTFYDQWHELGASAWYEQWIGALAELRERAATLLNATPAEIGLSASVSAALASIGSALDFRTRPRVVVAELDFPTLAYPWMVRPDIELVRVSSDDGVTVDPGRFADAVDDRTALVAVSHVFYSTGAIQPLRPLADIAHRSGAVFLVDGYQAAGQIPVDVQAADADIYIAGPLKWLLGGPGIAYVCVRRALIDRLVPTVTGWFAAARQFEFDIARFEFRDDARRFEMGTPALPTVHTALGGQSIIDEVGIHAIRARNRMLTERLVAGARTRGFRLRIADGEARSAIVMIARDEPAADVARLAERGIIVDHRPGHVRVSPHFYNTEDEIDLLLDALGGGPA
jgi:kynureninase